MNGTLKNVSEAVCRVLKREAKRNRRSLNAEMIRVLEAEATLSERRRQIYGFREERDR